MIVSCELKAGIVFGLETDVVHMMDEKEVVSEEETTIIYLHLGFFTVSFLMA